MSVEREWSPLAFLIVLALGALLAIVVDTFYSHPTDAYESQWRQEQLQK